ncbi:RNase P subunit p30 [Pseudomassariella vexata]|uniref:RNase P subunit p30 n=1 Tax=Pseudomassariella vexata TaxID=1141098 RepID=A0A1Y2DDJ3_9PEZI|nr:RNase P subunit p30 [Pseudomassariella vexata]ORY57186.1 RNase P subunit p30 [Pseudomassariella vexata]
MLYDLNIAWSSSTSAAELSRTLKFSTSLGYNVVALNHTINPPFPAQTVNPLPNPPPTPASKAGNSKIATANYEQPEILHRVTVILYEALSSNRLPQVAQAFDILAIRPMTAWAFQAACLSIAEASLISPDFTQQFDFHFAPKTCMAAVNRGMRFEICYAQFLLADARGRSNFIGNVMSLMRATKGRGLVVSSEAKGVMGLRGPADVANLLAVWGLGTERGMEALGVNPRAVVVNEGIKRTSFRGVIDIVQVAQREAGDKMEGIETEKSAAKEKGKGLSNENGGNGKKRKDGDNTTGEAPLSKRQAKKMKKLAVMEGKPSGNKA